jgi:hypothetical protein
MKIINQYKSEIFTGKDLIYTMDNWVNSFAKEAKEVEIVGYQVLRPSDDLDRVLITVKITYFDIDKK